MSSTALVSIVIPCYNYGEYLREAISSALTQTYRRIEVLVVDDGSNDSTSEVAASFGCAISFFKKANGGLSSARNFGLNGCRGEYVIFLDADDILQPTYVTRLLDVFKETNDAKLGFVYTQMELFGTCSEITEFPDFCAESLVEGNYVHASAMMPTEVVRRVGYDESMRSGWEDWNLYLGLVELGYYGKLVHEPLLRYRQHTSPHRAYSNKHDSSLQLEVYKEIARRHPSLFNVAGKIE